MKILLLSPYDALSHRYWREGITDAFGEHEFTVLSLPARYFSWRFRGNSLTFSQMAAARQDYDLLLATSMTDLSALRGMAPALTRCPNVLYFHENQFAYPDAANLDRQMTSLYSAIAADRVVFNSDYNRQTFLAGASTMLRSMPDHVPAGVVDEVAEKSSVLSVPLNADCFGADCIGNARPAERFSLLWNHRWEFDKGPEALLEIVTGLIERDLDFEFHLLGQSFRQVPPAIEACRDLLADTGRLGACGFLPRPDYLRQLRSSHVVLSTAIHEFQGLAVLEAVAAGCRPVVPDRLAYQELFDAEYRYPDVSAAIDAITRCYQQVAQGAKVAVPDVGEFGWPAQRDAWASVLEF